MLRTFLDRLYLWSGYAAGGFLIIIFILMMILSAGRPIGINLPAGDDFVSWCMAATAFLGLAHTFRSAEMIRVGLLIDNLDGRVRHCVEIGALIVGVFFTCFFAYYAVQMTYDFVSLQRYGAGRPCDPAVDSADRLFRRPRHSCDRVHRRTDPCPARRTAALREAQAEDRRRSGRAGHP